jgi:hypothetical protein
MLKGVLQHTRKASNFESILIKARRRRVLKHTLRGNPDLCCMGTKIFLATGYAR